MSRSDTLAAMMQQNMTRTLTPGERDIETITGEILEAKRAGGEAILTIGRCLIEAKEQLPHGEWLPWLNERVEFSERQARRFMQLYRECSNRPALADLGATKALALLALPPEEREQFVAEHNVVDMTSRQLQQAIRERDEARAAAEHAQADAAAAEQARAKMADDMRLFVTPSVNYTGQQEAELRGRRYVIYRTYRRRDSEETELYLEEKAGVQYGAD